jgi:hypothetical protein
MRHLYSFKLFESNKKDNLISYKDRNDIIDIFKWISNDVYDGEYPNIQILPSPSNVLNIHLQRFYHEEPFQVSEWMINSINYIMEVYGYKYGQNFYTPNSVSVSYQEDNPDYNEIMDLLSNKESPIPGGKAFPNTNKLIHKSKKFDKVEDAVGMFVNSMKIYLVKI